MSKTHITSVVAHIDHGKTTLIDSLLITQNVVSKQLAGELRCLDTRPDEQSRGITLKLSAIEVNTDTRSLTIIDTPGHVDFESLVQASSLLADSYLILVDVCEGISPRLLAITNYINDNAILVLNKIDKVESDTLYDVASQMIVRVNALVKSNLFSWERNNVILAWSTMCYGMSCKSFKSITPHSGLKNAVKVFVNLKEHVEAKKTEKIVEKFKIKGKSDKSIYMGTSPLWEVIFGCIDDLGEIPDGDEHLNGLTMFCVLNNTKVLKRENLLFATRLFSGVIRKNDLVLSKNTNSERECTIRNIYRFGVHGYTPVESASAPCLILIESDFLKHSSITKTGADVVPKDLSLKPKPFYNSRIILKSEQKDEFKEAMRTLSFLESVFKVKINSFGEYEVFTEGKVHFEKICHDLESNGFLFVVCEPEMKFCETPGKFHTEKLPGLEISIGKRNSEENLTESRIKCINQDKKNLPIDKLILDDKIIKNHENGANKSIGIKDDACKQDQHPHLKVGKQVGIASPIDNIESLNNQKGGLNEPTYNLTIHEIVNDDSSHREVEKSCVIQEEGTNTASNTNRHDLFKKISEENVNMFKDAVLNSKFNSIKGASTNESVKNSTKPIVIDNQEIEESNESGSFSDENSEFLNNNGESITPERLEYEKDTNILIYYRNNYENTVKSVFEYFLKNGPLINEKVMFAKIEILMETKPVDIPDLFTYLKGLLFTTHIQTDPYLIPFYFSCKIQILPSHLGQVYNALHKFFFIIQEECYEPDTDFYILSVLIPQFVYYSFVESLKMKTKGTTYLEFSEYGFLDNGKNFCENYLEGIRKNKGLFVEEKIVVDPEKQRTLKK